MPRQYFGTDGIRGRVGQSPITPEFVLRLGWAAGKAFAQEGKSKVLIGKDTRISGYMFESALEAGLASAGVDICLLGPIPTPGIAYLTRTFRAQAGIVISASHNPYYDNGIKFFGADGEKLPDLTELAIEEWLDKPMTCENSDRLGKAVRINDAAGRYIEFCKATVGSLSLAGWKIVLDCSNGATYQIAPSVFSELGAEVIALGNRPDGININEECGSTSPQLLQQRVLAEKADLGIAFDGDGDRVLMVDHQGEIVDGDQLLYIIATHYKAAGHLQGGVVGTLMSNMGLEVAMRDQGIPFARAKVGDRYVLQQLKENGWMLGGESSGHLLCLDAQTTGDGIVSALRVMAVLVESECSLRDWHRRMIKMPQCMINVRFDSRPGDPLKSEVISSEIKAVEASLKGRGRVLLRSSGTEPVIRVMVESEDFKTAEQCAKNLAEVVKCELKK